MRSLNKVFGFFLLAVVVETAGTPHHIQFSLPSFKIVQEIPKKDQDFATVIPGKQDTYIFRDEEAYYRDYQRSYFAITCKKGGWDCLRHYEILGNGCIPYFIGLEQADKDILPFLPKDLILEAMSLDGVSCNHIDHSQFNEKRYYELLEKILEYTRSHLSTRAMAQYLIDTIGHDSNQKILCFLGDISADYLTATTLIGLKELLGDRAIEFPRADYLYKDYPREKLLYGGGFSYSRVIEEDHCDRSNLLKRISRHEFDYILYLSVHRGIPYHSLVRSTYSPGQIIYFCGDDEHQCEFSNKHHLFLREFYQNDK